MGKRIARQLAKIRLAKGRKRWGVADSGLLLAKPNFPALGVTTDKNANLLLERVLKPQSLRIDFQFAHQLPPIVAVYKLKRLPLVNAVRIDAARVGGCLWCPAHRLLPIDRGLRRRFRYLIGSRYLLGTANPIAIGR
jgi:hypothetical protein